MSPRTLMIFMRAPQLGGVKTRLAATLGANAALAAHRELVEITLRRLAPIPTVDLRITPDGAAPGVSGGDRTGWTQSPQGGGTLGDRLHRGFVESFARGMKKMVAIGTDCPEITVADIEAAWEALDEADGVLGPALDGGYWLIGLRDPRSELFEDIDWGGPRVLRQTLDRFLACGLRPQLLRTLRDVDTEADWNEYRSRVAGPPS